MVIEEKGFDGYPKSIREIYNFLNQIMPILVGEGIYLPGRMSYEDTLINLIQYLSPLLHLSKTVRNEALADCSERSTKIAGLWVDNPKKHKITCIPYFFFTCALEKQREKFKKYKSKQKEYEVLCLPEIQQLAKIGDKLIAVLALFSDLLGKTKQSLKYTLPSMIELDVPSWNNLLKNETDFFLLWDNREKFFQLDENAKKFFEALIMLSPSVLSDLKTKNPICTMGQIEKALSSTPFKEWIDLSNRIGSRYSCDFGRVAKGLTSERIDYALFSVLFYGILLEYRVTKDDLFFMGLYDSLSNEQQRNELFKIVSDLGCKIENLRMFRILEIIRSKYISEEEARRLFQEVLKKRSAANR